MNSNRMQLLRAIGKNPMLYSVASGIIGNVIYAEIKNISFYEAFKAFFTYKIEIWFILAGILFFYFIYRIKIYFRKGKFKYTDETLAKDKEMYNKIKTIFKNGHLLTYLNNFNFSNDFNPKEFETFRQLEEENNRFFNPKLENMKSDLVSEIKSFFSKLRLYASPTKTVLYRIQKESPRKFESNIKELNDSLSDICKKYNELINYGQKIIK